MLRGNPGKRPLPVDEFQPTPAIPDCPAELTGAALDEWTRLTGLLGGVIAHVDRGALSMVCVTWGRFIEAERQIKQMAEQAGGGNGLFVKSPRGFPIQSPWLAVSNRALEMYTRLCTEFGLTPSSRTRIQGVSTAQPATLKLIPGGKAGWEQF